MGLQRFTAPQQFSTPARLSMVESRMALPIRMTGQTQTTRHETGPNVLFMDMMEGQAPEPVDALTMTGQGVTLAPEPQWIVVSGGAEPTPLYPEDPWFTPQFSG